MARWFSLAANKPLQLPTVQLPLELNPPPGGLAMLLDHGAVVRKLCGGLTHELLTLEAGHVLSAYLSVGLADTVPNDLAQWLEQPLELDFVGTHGEPIATRGWLRAVPEGWLLTALSVADLVEQAHNHDLRRHCLAQASQAAARLRNSSAHALPAVAGEVLETLRSTWSISNLAIVLPSAQGAWQVYASCHSFQTPELWPVGQVLDKALTDIATTTPLQLSAQRMNEQPGLRAIFGLAPALLIPWLDREGVGAWLLCGNFNAVTQAPALRSEEWRQLCALIAGALTSRLREQHEAHQQDRLGTLQGLLGTGWWEFVAQTKSLLLAPQLASKLSLQNTDGVALNLWLELLHPSDRDEFRVRLTSLTETGGEFIQCLRLRGDEAQNYIWYRLQAQAKGRGEQRRVFGFLLDISDIKAQETRAEAAHARLSNLIASAPAVIYVQDYADGALHLQYCSDSLQPLLGWSLSELQNGALGEHVHPQDHEIFFARNRQLLRDGAVSMRYRVRDRRGDYHWLLDEAKLLRNELGQPREAVGLWLDVTDVTLAAERIRESEERYRVLVEDSPAMICRYFPDLTLSFANRPLADYLECTPAELAGANLADWMSNEQQQTFVQRLASLSPEAPVSTAEICLQLPGREHAWWIWADRGIFDEQGQLVEVQAVGRDNTEVRKAQQQLFQGAKMATLGEMSTGMAHEMNQPLNVMRMAVANILRRLASGEVSHEYLEEKLQRIESQIQRAAKVVDHMRVFGRRSEVEQQQFDPRQAVEGALSLLADGLRNKGIELVVAEADDTPLQVCGFIDQLEQVLINLMVNARDAMLARKEREPQFAPCLAVHAERHVDWLHLLVEDNGGGIEVRLLERIFEPFFTTKEVGKGTGLGLSVSYGIIEQMGGRLTVSNVGPGAQFCIALPLTAIQPSQTEARSTLFK